MGTDIGECARRARLDTPVPVRFVKQPILRIRSLDHLNVAQFAGFAHAAHVLYLGVGTHIVEGAMRQTLFFGQRDHCGCFRDRGGQGLLAQYVLARLHRRLRHGEVQLVRSTYVNRIEFRIGQQILVVPGSAFDV